MSARFDMFYIDKCYSFILSHPTQCKTETIYHKRISKECGLCEGIEVEMKNIMSGCETSKHILEVLFKVYMQTI